MHDREKERRQFLKTAVVAEAAPQGYTYLHPEEAAFVEALVNHMVPADEHSPKGTDLGLHIYIDRALAGSWGKGDRMYQEGPWKQGVPSQGYQLPLTPAELYRAGIRATNAHCMQAYGKPSAIVWTPETLAAFLADPQKEIKGNRMPFSGMLDVVKHNDLITYLLQAVQ